MKRERASVLVRPFVAADQALARALIERSLGEHFGYVDRDANPDLVDIGASYADGAFFVAVLDASIVGTMGLIVEQGRCRMVRVAVAPARRRLGVASALLRRAVELAEQRGLAEIVAHTQPEWPDAVGFYRAHGFEIVGRDAVDVHLLKALSAARAEPLR